MRGNVEQQFFNTFSGGSLGLLGESFGAPGRSLEILGGSEENPLEILRSVRGAFWGTSRMLGGPLCNHWGAHDINQKPMVLVAF